MTPMLSLRLGRILGMHNVSPAERRRIVAAAEGVNGLDQLPADVLALLVEIQNRSGPLGGRTERPTAVMAPGTEKS